MNLTVHVSPEYGTAPGTHLLKTVIDQKTAQAAHQSATFGNIPLAAQYADLSTAKMHCGLFKYLNIIILTFSGLFPGLLRCY